jgi:hypothetical protein
MLYYDVIVPNSSTVFTVILLYTDLELFQSSKEQLFIMH